jgi:hypothetical protein
MYTLLLATLLVVPQDTQTRGQTMTSPLTDGQWTIVYAEFDGKRADTGTQGSVQVQGNMVTYMHDGKQCRVRLEFGPNNTVRAIKLDSGDKTGDKTAGRTDQRQGAQGQGAQSQGAQGQGQTGRIDDRNQTLGHGQETHTGVYISTHDLFCIGLDGKDTTRTDTKSDTERSAAGGQGAGNNTGGIKDNTGGNKDNQQQGQKNKIVLVLHKSAANR